MDEAREAQGGSGRTADWERERERFERVWRRVMPQRRRDCPFTLYGDEAGTERALAPCPGEEPPERALPPAVRGEDMGPGPGLVLQRFIAEELALRQAYRGLARRVPGRPGRTLAALGEDAARAARRLCAAYFLLTGVDPRPERRPERTPGWAALRGELRRCFLAEGRGEAACRAAAEGAEEELEALLLALAGEKGQRRLRLREALEGL